MSKVTQKHFRQPYRPSKVPLRPTGGAEQRPLFLPLVGLLLRYSLNQSITLFSPGYIPDLRSTVFLPDTIPLPDSSPFWSAPTDHQLVLPDILHNKILYQSINLMTINPIYRYCCYNLIFLLSLLYAPFYCPAVKTL